MSRILFILTSHDRLLDGKPTGLWLEEHAVPFMAFTEAGHEVTVTSVAGGDVPVDPNSFNRFALGRLPKCDVVIDDKLVSGY